MDRGRHNLGGWWQCRRGFGRRLGRLSLAKLVAVEAALAFPSFMVRRKGGQLAGIVAGQAVLPALNRVGYRWHGPSLSGLVAHGATIVLPARVVLGESSHLADVVAGQAVLPTLYRVGNRRDLQQREAIGRYCTASSKSTNNTSMEWPG